MAYHMNPSAVTATSDGLTTGQIVLGDFYVHVTSASANNIITLPDAGDLPNGWKIEGYVGANGCEMRTLAASGQTINGVDSDGTNEAAIPATTLFVVRKVDTNTFILNILDEGGDVVTAPVPDAA